METSTESQIKVFMVLKVNGTVGYQRNAILEILEPVFIALFFLVAFSANLLIIVTIGNSYRLRRIAFNWLIVNFAAACLLECLLNMTVALYYVSTADWSLSPPLCSFNSFAVQLATLEVSYAVVIICVERWIAAWKPTQFQKHLTVHKQLVAIATLWVSGILLCLPIASGVMESRTYPARYGCTMIDDDALIHGIFLTIWCYVLPVCFGGCCLLYLCYRKWKDKRSRKSKKSDCNSSEVFQDTFLWCEWAGLKLIVVLAVFYAILEIPYIVIQQNTEISKCFDKNNLPANSTLPDVEWTSGTDTAFTWFRYLYVSFFPFFVLWSRSDIRKKMVTLFVCCRKASMGDMSPRPCERIKAIENKRKKKKNVNNKTNLTTPVLFATPEGLHIRMLDPSEKPDSKDIQLYQSVTSNWTAEPRFVSYLCDIDERSIWGEWGEYMKDNDSLSDRRESQESKDLLLENAEEQRDVESPRIAHLSYPKDCKKKRVSNRAKSVHFADTITIFRPETPKLSRIFTPKFKLFPKPSRIPRPIKTKEVNANFG